MQLEQNNKYEAELQLGMFESLVDNSVIANKFREVGFSDVLVAGSGKVRIAQGTWKQASRDVSLPSQIKKVKKL